MALTARRPPPQPHADDDGRTLAYNGRTANGAMTARAWRRATQPVPASDLIATQQHQPLPQRPAADWSATRVEPTHRSLIIVPSLAIASLPLPLPSSPPQSARFGGGGATFREHMARARADWTAAAATVTVAMSTHYPSGSEEASLTRRGSGPIATPRPPPARAHAPESPSHPRASSAPMRRSPPSSSGAISSSPPVPVTNLTHVACGRVVYPGEYFSPLPCMPPSGRFHRGWELMMPERDDREEEAIWLRNMERGVQPPLQTLTEHVLKLRPKILAPFGVRPAAVASNTASGHATPAANDSLVMAAVGPPVRLKQKMRPFFTLPDGDEPSTAGGGGGPFVRRRHVLYEDKNDWTQLRLLARGLEKCVVYNAAQPAGVASTRDYSLEDDAGHDEQKQEGVPHSARSTFTGSRSTSRAFNSLFPDRSLLPERSWLSSYKNAFPTVEAEVARERAMHALHRAKHTARTSVADPRAKANTKVKELYRPGTGASTTSAKTKSKPMTATKARATRRTPQPSSLTTTPRR